MDLQQLLLLMQTDTTKCITYCEACALVPNVYQEQSANPAHWDENRYKQDPLLQYNPYLHSIVTDKIARPDKIVSDSEGQFTKFVKPARLPAPIQKKIVLTAAAFLGSPKLEANDDNADYANMLLAINDTFDLNKLDYRFRTISKTTMSEKACAELWYTVPAGDTSTEQYKLNSPDRLRMKILARSKGDSLYPVFDEYDNLIAFGRGYWTLDENAQKIQHFDIYTDDKSYHSQRQTNQSWYFLSPAGVYAGDFVGIPNPFGKIPVIYYWQPLSEWADVQRLIERYELIISNNADTNDYFGNPILLGIGKVLSLSDKGASGKTLELENGGDAKYLTWDNGPKSIEMEMKELKEAIYGYTHTPDISFDKLMGLGYFSTVALKTLFTDAHFKAADKEEIFGEGVQRRINFLKAALAIMDKSLVPGLSLVIKPKFTYYIPENITEEVDRIATAISAGIMSKETGVDQNPMVDDSEAELARIKEDEANAASLIPIPAPIKAPSTSAANN